MSSALQRNLLALLLLTLALQTSDGQFMEWCIADEQTPDDELQMALDWACGRGGADCSKIEAHQPCFLPNTIRDHATYAFNNYYQKFKHKGATCYFNAAAMITDLDPNNLDKSAKKGNGPHSYRTGESPVQKLIHLSGNRGGTCPFHNNPNKELQVIIHASLSIFIE